jgi:hypothetical protein
MPTGTRSQSSSLEVRLLVSMAEAPHPSSEPVEINAIPGNHTRLRHLSNGVSRHRTISRSLQRPASPRSDTTTCFSTDCFFIDLNSSRIWARSSARREKRARLMQRAQGQRRILVLRNKSELRRVRLLIVLEYLCAHGFIEVFVLKPITQR